MQKIPDMAELMKLARSPAGQQLLAHLQNTGGERLQNALATASAGDYAQAKQTLSSLLESPEARKLLKQLEDSK